jgi:hypothetical protein
VFRRLKKLERIPAHSQRQFQFFDGAQVAHHSYSIRLLKESVLGTRHWQAIPATKLLEGQSVGFIDQDAQRIALPEIPEFPR